MRACVRVCVHCVCVYVYVGICALVYSSLPTSHSLGSPRRRTELGLREGGSCLPPIVIIGNEKE